MFETRVQITTVEVLMMNSRLPDWEAFLMRVGWEDQS